MSINTSLLADTGNDNQQSSKDVITTVQELRNAFNTGRSKSYQWRTEQLKAVRKFLVEQEEAIIAALCTDLGRCKFEAVGLEVISLKMELDFMLSNLSSWMKSTCTSIPAIMAPGISEITYEPYGVVLVMGAFNYPISLTLGPLVGAIAAGNCVLIKPSELSMACEALLRDVLPKYIDSACFAVVCGGIDVNQRLLQTRFDKIFFTGSPRVGKIVAKAAAEHLTPVSLELGGKSPTIVDESVANLELAATRICWGKFANAGQTCIAPDYVFVHESQYEAFVNAVKERIVSFYGADPSLSENYGRIVSQAHCKRLQSLLLPMAATPVAGNCNTTIAHGGRVDVENLYVEPTILTEMSMDSAVMKEEIFGPILPIVKYKHLQEVVEHINAGEKPLVMYIFSKSNNNINRLIRDVSSGGVLINDTLFHFGNFHAPFGGVGQSGVGSYHGKFSFECFSHRRTVLRRDDHWLLDIPVRYPPYTDWGLSLFRFSASCLPAMPACCAWVCCCYWRCDNCSCCDGHRNEKFYLSEYSNAEGNTESCSKL